MHARSKSARGEPNEPELRQKAAGLILPLAPIVSWIYTKAGTHLVGNACPTSTPPHLLPPLAQQVLAPGVRKLVSVLDGIVQRYHLLDGPLGQVGLDFGKLLQTRHTNSMLAAVKLGGSLVQSPTVLW